MLDSQSVDAVQSIFALTLTLQLAVGAATAQIIVHIPNTFDPADALGAGINGHEKAISTGS